MSSELLKQHVRSERKRQLQTLRSVDGSVSAIEAFVNDEISGKCADPQKVRALTQKIHKIVGELKKVLVYRYVLVLMSVFVVEFVFGVRLYL